MSDEFEVPVKVVDRRWWANQDAQAGESSAAPSSSSKPSYVEELEQKLADKDKLLQEAISRYRGAATEFEESRLRLRREISKDVERSRREVLADLLDVVDNLDRAVEAARGNTAPDRLDSLIQGVDMVRRQFLAKLEGFGVRRIESDGQPFDPALHEAVSAVPASAAAPDGTIVGIVRHGYRIGEDVLRPASVAVAKG
jgi:molecular chaperone GrpE